MKFIGITGGVGTGKSTVLDFLKVHYNCEVLLADNIANELKKPGEICYKPVVELLGEEVLDKDGFIDNVRMAGMVFGNSELLGRINNIIHPEVRNYVISKKASEQSRGELDYLFFEAALLIEAGYKPLLDELWFIFSDVECRVKRLMASRGYSEEKCRSIIAKQLSDTEFRAAADFVIDNSGDIEYTQKQIVEKLGEQSWRQ